jgi:EAL domain-containing protein (putative c-di-GMP-specific phosphodiesterase class I)
MAKIALLIGVSEYEPELNPLPAAVKDVKALQQVLQDPEIGGFYEVRTLINPELQVMQYEIESVFTERNKDDLVLLFFSGHGIKDDSNNLYFATRTTRKNPKGDLSKSTAVPARFVHEVMSSSQAKRQAIILDCCFSGAFDPSLQAKDDGSFDLQGQLGAEGRVVLASSSSTQYSFEQKNSDLSIYTHYLIEGLKTGNGDHNKDGQISILELHDYVTRKVQEEIPNVTPRIIVLKDKGFEIIIARTKNEQKKLLNENYKRIDLGPIKLDTDQYSNRLGYYNSIPSLLQSLSPFIERLIEQFKSHYLAFGDQDKSSSSESKNFILESIRRASNADFVFLMHYSPNQDIWTLKSQSDLEHEINELNYADLIRSRILSNISTEFIFTTGHHGVYRIYYDEVAATSKAFILIPLDLFEETEFLVICGLSKDSLYINDAYTRIISSFYKATYNLHLPPSRAEGVILDDLKREYGFLPLSLYNRRFELFCEQLEQIVIYFQPILDMDDVAITRWEALARDPESLQAPVDLFDAAELWGRKFTTELDIELLERTVKYYREARIASKRARADEILPLSVNVYPESLMREAYYKTVAKITQPSQENYLIPARKLILEISEKTSLPSHSNGIRLRDPLKTFKNRLLEYRRKLKIKFGIDDFGVGHSSVSRLAGLNPPYIKIDRDILHQPHADIIIRFVNEIVEEASQLKDSEVIIEGVDEDSPVSLYELKKLGINYVQGYIVGEAGPDIYRLSSEKSQLLRKQIYRE